ncbi:MAG: HYR domain-containing protein [Verrucomicrobia bacterium]|nr:HYR domain-containing protein [Verrucomicrobiota bacterium]
MRTANKSWKYLPFIVLAFILTSTSARASIACTGNTEVVAEYLFFEGAGSTVVNTGADGDDGNAVLTNGASFNSDVPPSNAGCGWSIQLPATGAGSTTPAIETAGTYDPLAGASNFTLMAWIKRASGGSNSNTSARIVSDTSSLTLTSATAGVEFRFSGSAGTLSLRVNGNEVSTTVGGIAPNSNVWRHVAVVYDGTRPATNTLTRNAHFYVDGIQRGSGNTLQDEVVGANTNRLTLGNSSVGRGAANIMVGKMDDMLILYGFAPYAVGNGETSAVIRCFMLANDDIERPTITCPDNVSVGTDPGLCTASNVNLGQAAAGDNCGVASLVNDAPAVFPAGTNLVIWTTTDYAGNSISCTQMVTVTDSEPPTISCPPDITTNTGPCLVAITNLNLGQPIASDNCGVVSLISFAPAEFPVGTTSVTWKAWDAAGNQDECSQQVTVEPSQTADCDGDGLTDWEEVQVYQTDPDNPSTAGDGLSDGWKVQYGFDPTVSVPAECRPRYW